ncbi:hypothetical protein BJ875DRAFT_475785 [Amylocarpus encephaloides]|uniref:Rhodopsin domain-containing protein n=1 Tax=Amylocarpus encephaloides TaxID=45428 RepID=A0A9P7Y9U2_9HELO|nr:hypothetical protein BJ875DRAFT_475785 [Amylocarpus encephaloides]
MTAMEAFRRFSSDLPESRVFRDDKPVMLISWWCTVYAITVIAFRVVGRYVRTERTYREDTIMLLAIIPLLIRQSLVHVVLLFGTNNTVLTDLSSAAISRRELGSKLVLVTRILYSAYLWSIKFSTSTFLHQLTASTAGTGHKHMRLLRGLHGILLLTFIANIISDLAPCQPFSHFWQVTPDPGVQCRSGYSFLLTNGISNIVTNVALVLFPLPVILASKLTIWKKLSIVARLALPLFSVGFTIYCLITILPTSSHPSSNNQGHRTLMASLDILLNTFIANAVVLMSLIRDRGYKKSKWKWEVIATGKEAGGSGRSITKKVRTNWDAREGQYVTVGTNTKISGGGGRKDVWGGGMAELNKKGSLIGINRGEEESSIEMTNFEGSDQGSFLKDEECGVRMDGVERPERARLLGEIRVAREWEVRTSR